MADKKIFHRLVAGFGSLLLLGGLAGCLSKTPQSSIEPHSDNAHYIQEVYGLVTWIDVGIFVVVFGLLLFALVKFREKKGQAIPKQVEGHLVLEIIWTLIPAVLLIFIAVPTWIGIFRAYNPPAENALHVKAIGHQWWFEFNYPGLGTVTANELHVPVNKPVVVEVHSADVVHSFWVPKLAGKVDMMPGQKNQVWFTPETEGMFLGQCAEFCGTSHANMRFRVMVESESDFNAWIERLKQAPNPATDDAKAGRTLFAQKACVACHTIANVPGAVGIIGPNLTNLAGRTTIAAGLVENTPANLARWIHNPQAVKPGALMALPIPVSEAEAAQLAAFLTSPPGEGGAMAAETPAPAAAPAMPAASAAMAGGAGDAAKGEQVYKTICFVCHGPDPAKDGPLGPAIAGSPRALIEARVMNGNADYEKSYPPGYTPKRNTKLMTPFPHLKGDIDNLAAYLAK